MAEGAEAADAGPLVFVGGAGFALTVQTSRAPGPGETVFGTNMSTAPGGKASNQAIGASRLGCTSRLFSAVGGDDFGRSARDLWLREGVDASCVSQSAQPTMVGVILVDDTGENRIVVIPGALASISAEDVDALAAGLSGAAACVVSLEIHPSAATAALRLARRLGVPTILAPAPFVKLPAEVWADVDLILPNHSEAVALLDGANLPDEDLPHALEERYGARAVVTLGSRGAAFARRGETVRVFGPAVEAVDTTGAGDAFTAAFTAAWSRRRDLMSAARYGVAAGSIAVRTGGVVESLPHRDELEREVSAVRSEILEGP